jgi:hypothetical protein
MSAAALAARTALVDAGNKMADAAEAVDRDDLDAAYDAIDDAAALLKRALDLVMGLQEAKGEPS